jgi:peptidoglycan/xylan/chitin deacetylase (PgdA/CDA1 family)
MFFSLPVLMYHSVSRFKHRLCVSPELFEEHCRVLAEAGWRGVSLSEAEDYFCRKRRLPRKTLLFTFDDGYLDNYVNAEPILHAHGHKGVIFTVTGLIETGDILRPATDVADDAAFSGPLPNLDARTPVRRDTGYRVTPIVFCSWQELAAMRQRGVMDVAPHSMRHHRVITGLDFTGLYTPNSRYSFFDVSPQKAVWGMPRFPLDHGLAHRGYEPTPELYSLVKTMVPQQPKEAQAFLSKEENRNAVVAAIKKLPCLGIQESEEQYRKRLADEFTACREIYETRLGVSPVSFCWPWGSYTSPLLKEAKKAGFRVFFTTLPGMNPFGKSEAVCRLAVRGGSGRDLLGMVRAGSSTLLVLPFELYRRCRRFSRGFSSMFTHFSAS